jgi:elongation factor Tu
MVMPDDNAEVLVDLDKAVAIDVGSHFAIREGGRTVGSGVITEVVE